MLTSARRNLLCWAIALFLLPQGGAVGQPAQEAAVNDAEACCFEYGCWDLLPWFCDDWGGVPQGPGTSCAATACPEQACCLPDGTCQDLPPDDCDAVGGERRGLGSACATETCQPFEACCFEIRV